MADAVVSSTTVLGLLGELIDAILPDDGEPNDKPKYFAEKVVNIIEGVFNDLATYDKALAHSAGAETPAAASVESVLEAGFIFIDTVDDFFYYGKETDFEGIKRDIRDQNTAELMAFISKMDDWLENVRKSYEKFKKECKKSSDMCTKWANYCASHQADARLKKHATRAVGGTATAVMLGGGIAASAVAGALTLGIGAIVGLSLTAAGLCAFSLGTAVATGVTAYHFSEAEAAFKSASSNFLKLANHGIELKSYFSDIHQQVTRFKTNHSFLSKTNHSDINTLCSTLDRLKSLLESQRLLTSQARNTLLTFKQRFHNPAAILHN